MASVLIVLQIAALISHAGSVRYSVIDLVDLKGLPGVPRISRSDVATSLFTAALDVKWSKRTAVLTSER